MEETVNKNAEVIRTYIPLDEIEENGKLVREIGYKSYIAAITLIGFGILIFLASGTMFKVFGVLFVLSAVAYILFVKDTVLVRLYDDGIVFIDPDKNEGFRIDYNEVAEWNLKNGAVNVTRNDGILARADTPIAYRANAILRRYVPDQETRVLREDQRIDFKDLINKNKQQ